jgi:hypothetical protein
MAFNFKRITEEIQARNGFCRIPNHKFAGVPGFIYSAKAKGMIPATFHYVFYWQRNAKNEMKAIIKFLDGPTGHEGYYLDDILTRDRPDVEYWHICAGGGAYPEAVINTAEFFAAIARFQELRMEPPALLDFGR